ncbi:MAG: phosphoglycerate kinase [Pseudomonadota bacterium]
MSGFNRLDSLGDLTGKTALVRVDFNVPMNDGAVTDDTRLRAALPTVEALTSKGAKVALLAHFDRPKGQIVPEMSLKPVATAFSEVFDAPVTFAENCTIGPKAKAMIDSRMPGDVILLENVRFLPGEEANDPGTIADMANLGDLYVNDAFSAAHRAHASTAGLAGVLPAYAGKAMERELDALEAALGQPERPVLAVVGGAKVSTKIELLMNLVAKVNALAIGGGMANTFLAARGHPVGKSLCEHDLVDMAKKIERNALACKCDILLPRDVVVAKAFEANAPHRICGLDDVADDEMILDAGPQTVAILATAMDTAKTLIWNGPLGAFELTPFDKATVQAATAAAARCKAGRLIAVAGGGDTVAALNHAGVAGDFTFVSTAGGAFLEWMEGKALPGVDALRS